MNIFKSIAQVIVQQAGHPLPSDATSVLKGIKSGNFKTLLAQRTTNPSLAVPAPPTPPADPTDLEAQKAYNDALLAYNQQFQTYHTQMVGTLLQRMQWMQQLMLQQRNSNTPQSSTASASRYSSGLGIGGILDSSSDM